MSGPTPKRSDQRRRRNKSDAPETKAPSAGEPESAEADASWHPVAKRWYESLAKSGQSRFYEQSDWDTAYLIAESLSRDLKPQVIGMNPETGKPVRATIPLKGASLSAYIKAMGELMTTEGVRRRTKLELQRNTHTEKDPSDEAVTNLDDYRDRAG